MAIRRQTRRHRIANVGNNQAQGQAGYTPVQGAVSGGRASPGAAMVMPLAAVVISVADPGQYATVGYTDLPGIFTTDGAMVPATAPGRWGQLVAAGKV